MPLRSLHYIRAVAMTLVVAAHVQSTWQALSPAQCFLDHVALVFLHGGAIGIFFVVAGFLFHHQQWQRVNGTVSTDGKDCTNPKEHQAVSLLPFRSEQESSMPKKESNMEASRKIWTNFDSLRYVRSRIWRIGWPYLAISVPVLLHRMYLEEEKQRQVAFSVHESTALEEHYWSTVARRMLTMKNLRLILEALRTGRGVNYAYWFVPVIMILCCLSPIVIFLLKASKRVQISTLLCTYAISLILVGRPSKNGVWPLVLYFWPLYLSGSLISLHYARFANAERWTGRFTILLLFVVVCQVKYGSDMLTSFPVLANVFNLMQMFLTTGFAFATARRYDRRQARPRVLHFVLERIADTSFEIYLIHPWVIAFIDKRLKEMNWKEQLQRAGWCTWLLETLVVIVASVGLAVIWRWMVRTFRSPSKALTCTRGNVSTGNE